MPGSIKQSGSKWIVYWGGKKRGSHASKKKAQAQMRALQAAEHREGKK